MKISGAIFDMDGTLTDSMFIWENSGMRYAGTIGLAVRPDFETVVREMSMAQVAEYIGKEYGVKLTAQEIIDGINKMVEPMYRDEVQPKRGVPEFLEELKGRGVRMCLATATDISLVEMVLRKLDLLKYFEKIFTCTMVGAGKEKPDIYEAALKFLGTPREETPVFEDALFAARTVKSAGFPLVAVYDSDVGEEGWREMQRLADVTIEDYTKASAKLF